VANLTDRQQKILSFIRRFMTEQGYPPTIREIGRQLDISSTSVVNYNLNKLVRVGLLERDSQVSRGLKLPGGSEVVHTVTVPLLGSIAAGRPIPVLDGRMLYDADDQVELTRDITRDREGVYALKVKGDSMIDALIKDGDIVVLQHAETADNGEMVAAWIEDPGETTLKRIFRENGRIRLQPANPTMGPIYYPAEQVRVQGRVIAVIRSRLTGAGAPCPCSCEDDRRSRAGRLPQGVPGPLAGAAPRALRSPPPLPIGDRHVLPATRGLRAAIGV
jgi:repressor LexA